jgi:hypothetical protein
MARARGMTDRLGLPLTTRSAVAAEQYLIGVDRFLSLNAGADESFRLAIEADDTFALPFAALAILLRFQANVEQARSGSGRGCGPASARSWW